MGRYYQGLWHKMKRLLQMEEGIDVEGLLVMELGTEIETLVCRYWMCSGQCNPYTPAAGFYLCCSWCGKHLELPSLHWSVQTFQTAYPECTELVPQMYPPCACVEVHKLWHCTWVNIFPIIPVFMGHLHTRNWSTILDRIDTLYPVFWHREQDYKAGHCFRIHIITSSRLSWVLVCFRALWSIQVLATSFFHSCSYHRSNKCQSILLHCTIWSWYSGRMVQVFAQSLHTLQDCPLT